MRVVGVQAAIGATVPASLDEGVPVTIEDPDIIADGFATGGVSELTLGLIREHVEEVVTVTEEEIAEATLVVLQRAKQLVEGAGPASVGALLSEDVGEAFLLFQVVTSGRGQAENVVGAIEDGGYEVERVN